MNTEWWTATWRIQTGVHESWSSASSVDYWNDLIWSTSIFFKTKIRIIYSINQPLRMFQTIKSYSQPFIFWMMKDSQLRSMMNKHCDIDDYWMQRCSCCNQKIAKRKEMFSKVMLTAAIKAFEYAVKYNTQTVNIRELWLNNIEYTKMNSLVRFGLAYKNDSMKVGEYWIPRKRIRQFLDGEWTIASHYWNDPTKDRSEAREMSTDRIRIDQIPSIEKLRSIMWMKLSEYQWNNDFE